VSTRTIALGALLSLALAACGSTTGSPSPAALATSPASPGSPSPSPSIAPASPAPSTALASPSPSGLPHGAPALEAAFPKTVDGKVLEVQSYGPAELVAASGPTITTIITEAGGDPARASLAAANDAATGTFNMIALSAPGADGAKLIDAYATASIASGQAVMATKTSLGGKSVTWISSPVGDLTGDVWVYSVKDVMYGVQTRDKALAAKVIALLP
jgi:hypothetical protein